MIDDHTAENLMHASWKSSPGWSLLLSFAFVRGTGVRMLAISKGG